MTTTDDATDLPTCWEVQPQHGLCTNLQATPTPDEMNENAWCAGHVPEGIFKP